MTNLDILCRRGASATGELPFGSHGGRYGDGLFLHTSGRARLAQIQGYLVGLAHGGQAEYAERLATDLLGHLRYLNGYGGVEETPWGELPRYRVALTSDSSPLGFGLSWLRRDSEPDQNSMGAAMDDHYNFLRFDLWREGIEHNFYWRRSFCGGLLFHGPGGSPNAVDLNAAMGQETFWGVHT